MVTEQQQPGDELGKDMDIVTFRRKPAKTGTNYLIWIPRTMVRDGRIDPDAEYEVYLRKIGKTRR